MRKLINTLTMTAAIFILSTAAPAETYAASLVKPWTNGAHPINQGGIKHIAL